MNHKAFSRGKFALVTTRIEESDSKRWFPAYIGFGVDVFVVTGRKCTHTVLPTTGVPHRDIMFTYVH